MTRVLGPIRVLFVCTGNSARSQIAEALLRQQGGPAFDVASAGTEPKGVNPLTVRVLAEVGIDITSARSKSVTEFLDQRFDYVITVCDQARAARSSTAPTSRSTGASTTRLRPTATRRPASRSSDGS